MRRGLIVLVLAISSAARANEPPEPCIVETGNQIGYTWGALFAGFFATPNLCARLSNLRGFDRFPLVLAASELLQADAGTGDTGLRRARLTVSAVLWRRVTLVASGDAAERSVPDAYLSLGIVRSPAVLWATDDTFDFALQAGHRGVPFGLENAWSDAKLPFLEHTTAISALAPLQRQDGLSLAAVRTRHFDPPIDSAYSDERRVWFAEAGVFQPFDERESYTAIGRAFLRRERDSQYVGNLVSHLHLGVSAAVGRRRAPDPMVDLVADGRERAVAVEAEVRYLRFTAWAELIAASQEMRSQRTGIRETMHGSAGALTLSATLPIDRYRWWSEPLQRDPIPTTHHVDPLDADDPNVSLELDVGLDALREETGAMTMSTTKLRSAAHLFVHDFVKLSCAYAYTTETRSHEVLARLQLAL